MKIWIGAALACAFALSTGPAFSQASEEEILYMYIPAEVSLVREDGKYKFQSEVAQPFYTYDLDEPNVSNCTGECAETWWPVRSRGNVPQEPWSLVERDDGRPQLAYKGKPIYYYVEDEVGTQRGDGIDGVWHVLEP